YRRSLYTYWRRTIAPPSMMNFDSPSREVCVVRENRTNTPLQALNLMNDTIYLEAARKLAERLMMEGGVAPGVMLVLGRAAHPHELEVVSAGLARFQTFYRAHPEDAAKFLNQGESPRNSKLDVADLAAYTGVASLLLNMDETVTRQ